MPELDKQFNFNAFHICIIILSINLMLSGSKSYMINLINYIINAKEPDSWYIPLQILTIYLVLSNLKFEFGFHIGVKFNQPF